MREGNQKSVSRDYYYADLHAAIDAIKYRVWHLTQKVKDLYKPSEEKKEYACRRCGAQWTQFEVLDSFDHVRGTFICHRCGGPLQRDEVSAADRAGHERQSKLMAQLDHLLRLLKQIDEAAVPQNDFPSALAHAVPVTRDPTVHPPTAPYLPVKADPKTAAANKPAVQTVAVDDLEVSVLGESATSEADRAAKERKAAQEQQNALPSWYTQSTVPVPGDTATKPNPATANGTLPTASMLPVGLKREGEPEDAKPAKESLEDGVDPVAAYYAEMQEERRREAERPPSDASEVDEDEEHDGFEDVVLNGGTSAVNTPSSSFSGTPASVAKRRGVESGDASTSGAATPGVGADRDEESPAKRVKLDTGAAIPAEAGTTAAADEGESDEDEFEDAL